MSSSAAQIILTAELLAWRHRLLSRGPGRLVLLGIALLAAAVFIGGGAFTIGAAAGHFLPMTRDTILTGGFTSLSVLMLVIGFPTVIATFFVGRELLQLVLAPVRPIDIFAAFSPICIHVDSPSIRSSVFCRNDLARSPGQ